LLLLVAADSVSAFLGECTDALIIGVIIAASVGLGFGNEYRAERAAEALHSQVRHVVTVLRDGAPTSVEVTHVVPGDVVHLDVGSTVPADMRVLAAEGLACDESILTSESTPAPSLRRPSVRTRRWPSCLARAGWAGVRRRTWCSRWASAWCAR